MYTTGAFAGLGSGGAAPEHFVGSLVGQMLPQPPVLWTGDAVGAEAAGTVVGEAAVKVAGEAAGA